MSKNLREQEISAEVISNFKQVVDGFNDRRVDLKTFQAAISEYLDDDILSSKIKIEIVDLSVHALPKAIFGTYYYLLEDVAQLMRVYRRCEKRLGKRKGSVTIELGMARDNIIFLFQDAFHKNLAEEVAREEEVGESFDRTAMAVAGDTRKSYNKHLKRNVRHQLKKEEKRKDDDDDDDDDDQNGVEDNDDDENDTDDEDDDV